MNKNNKNSGEKKEGKGEMQGDKEKKMKNKDRR